MVDEAARRGGRQKLHDGPGGDRGSAVDTGLPLQPPDAQGSEWNPFVRLRGEGDDGCAPVRDDAIDSAAGSSGEDCGLAVPSVGRRLRSGSNGAGRNGDDREESGIPSFEEVIDAQFPDVQDGHRGQAEETTALDPIAGLRREFDVLEPNPNKLDYATDLSLSACLKILEQEYLPSTHSDHFRQLSLKKDTAMGIMTIALRADENRFRKRNQDILEKLLTMAKADKKLTLTQPTS